MDLKTTRIAVICNYQLLENRIGGMDYFFWAFHNKCKAEQIKIDWFFPNAASYGQYEAFKIIADKDQTIEATFINYIKTTPTNYTHVITHFVELCTSFYAEVKHLLNTKIIAVDHNPRPLGGYPLQKQIKKKIKGRLYGKHIDEFIGVSDYTSQAILQDFGRFLKPKTKTIYNGLNKDIYKKKDFYNFQFKFLTTSHLREEKGIQDLLEAISCLPKRLRDKIKIDIYGNGPYKKTLKDMVRKMRLEKNIFFKGNVKNLNEIYKNYDYLIHPSRGETFCYSVLEAVICDLPVITTLKNGNILKLIINEKNGFIYKEKDVLKLTQILKVILERKINIKEINNYNLSKKFSLEQMVSNYMNLIK